MFNFVPDVEVPESFSGYSFILPSVSVGNVGQLCVDLLISSLRCTKVGFLWHPSIMPMVGGDAFDSSSHSITTSAELHVDKTQKLLFLQIRSPVLKTLVQDVLNSLLQWVQKNNISKIIVLTGSSSTVGKGDLIEGKKLRYAFTSNLLTDNMTLLNELKWTSVKKVPNNDTSISSEKELFPGGGFANQLFHFCAEKSIPAAVLIKYCSEGDNIPDACDLAEYLNQWLNIYKRRKDNELQWIYPFSWKFMFGNLPPRKLY